MSMIQRVKKTIASEKLRSAVRRKKATKLIKGRARKIRKISKKRAKRATKGLEKSLGMKL